MLQLPKDYSVRFVNVKDTQDILDIYQPFISDTAVTFEVEIPSIESFANRIDLIQKDHPYLVVEYKGEVIGYAYSSAHRGRISYQWSKELSIYLSAEHRGNRLGVILYKLLIKILVWQGVKTALAGITIPNEGSVLFHEKLGFKFVGTYPSIGFKAGVWHDVSWYSLMLNTSNEEPVLGLKDYRQYDKLSLF